MSKPKGVLNDTGVVLPGDESFTEPTDSGNAPVNPHHTKNSILTDTDNVFDVSRAFSGEGADGTIVTDKRHKKLGLGGAIWGALKEWGGNIANATSKQMSKFEKPEEATVVSPQARKETIKQAASMTARKPTNDHTIVMSKLKQKAPPKAPPATNRVKLRDRKEVEEKKVGWTHTTEPEQKQGQHTLNMAPHKPKPAPPAPAQPLPKTVEKPTPKNKEEELYVKQSIATKKAEPQKKKGIFSLLASSKKASEPEPQTALQRSMPSLEDVARERNTPLPKKGWSLRSPRKESNEQAVAEPLPKTVEKPTPEPTKQEPAPITKPKPTTVKRPETTPAQAPWWFNPYIMAIAFLLVVLGGTLFSKIQSTFTPGEGAVALQPLPNFIPGLVPGEIVVGSTANETFTAIMNTVSNSTDATAYVLTDTDGQLLTARDIFTTLNTRTPSTLEGTAGTNVYFGGVGGQPFIAMSGSFDALYGGMLQWESVILQDLGPLYGAADTLQFTDESMEGVSVRVARTSNGGLHLLWAVINQNVLLITNSRSALATFVSQLQ